LNFINRFSKTPDYKHGNPASGIRNISYEQICIHDEADRVLFSIRANAPKMDIEEIRCEDEELAYPYRIGTSDDQSCEHDNECMYVCVRGGPLNPALAPRPSKHDNEPSGFMNVGEFID
jgi:hypothetical protein